MDPNAALAEIRKLVERASDLESFPRPDPAELLTELAEAVEGLDEWLSKGGFLPTAWNKQTLIWTLSEEDEKKLYVDLDRARTFRIGVDWGTLKWDGGNGWVAGLDPDQQPAQQPAQPTTTPSQQPHIVDTKYSCPGCGQDITGVRLDTGEWYTECGGEGEGGCTIWNDGDPVAEAAHMAVIAKLTKENN